MLVFRLDLRMFQNRITLFLLHYLYYAPIIYYLNKDEVFIVNKITGLMEMKYNKRYSSKCFDNYGEAYYYKSCGAFGCCDDAVCMYCI